MTKDREKVRDNGDKKIAAYVCRVPTCGEIVTLHYVLTNRRLLVSYDERKTYRLAKRMYHELQRDSYEADFNANCERLAR